MSERETRRSVDPKLLEILVCPITKTTLEYDRERQELISHAARLVFLEELRRSAHETYGEDRAAEASLKTALEAAATAVWRVSQETLEPQGHEPLPTHG